MRFIIHKRPPAIASPAPARTAISFVEIHHGSLRHEIVSFGIFCAAARWAAARSFAESHLHYLRQMEGAAIGGLRDLLAATESIGDDERVLRRLPHGRQQRPLADLQRHVVVVTGSNPNEPAMPQQPESSRSKSRPIASDAFVGGQSHDGLLMAMAVHDRFRRCNCGGSTCAPWSRGIRPR